MTEIQTNLIPFQNQMRNGTVYSMIGKQRILKRLAPLTAIDKINAFIEVAKVVETIYKDEEDPLEDIEYPFWVLAYGGGCFISVARSNVLEFLVRAGGTENGEDDPRWPCLDEVTDESGMVYLSFDLPEHVINHRSRQ